MRTNLDFSRKTTILCVNSVSNSFEKIDRRQPTGTFRFQICLFVGRKLLNLQAQI